MSQIRTTYICDYSKNNYKVNWAVEGMEWNPGFLEVYYEYGKKHMGNRAVRAEVKNEQSVYI